MKNPIFSTVFKEYSLKKKATKMVSPDFIHFWKRMQYFGQHILKDDIMYS